MDGESGDSRRGRPRRAETDRLIRQAAVGLLRERGPQAVNIDAVAARSGVARTTIYRRFRDRRELVEGVLDEVLEAGVPTPDLPVPDKLHWLLERVLDLLEHGIGRGGTAALLTDSDPDFTAALRGRLGEQLDRLRGAMAEDVASGRLAATVDPDTLVGLLFGAYLGEVLRYGGPRLGWAGRTVDLLGPAVSAD